MKSGGIVRHAGSCDGFREAISGASMRTYKAWPAIRSRQDAGE